MAILWLCMSGVRSLWSRCALPALSPEQHAKAAAQTACYSGCTNSMLQRLLRKFRSLQPNCQSWVSIYKLRVNLFSNDETSARSNKLPTLIGHYDDYMVTCRLRAHRRLHLQAHGWVLAAFAPAFMHHIHNMLIYITYMTYMTYMTYKPTSHNIHNMHSIHNIHPSIHLFTWACGRYLLAPLGGHSNSSLCQCPFQDPHCMVLHSKNLIAH
jgi:hypothetical protein